jgi:hypothetical protein
VTCPDGDLHHLSWEYRRREIASQVFLCAQQVFLCAHRGASACMVAPVNAEERRVEDVAVI